MADNPPTYENPDISPYGYVANGKVYLKGYLDFKDREIGVVREDPDESLRYFVNRFEMVSQKVADVEKAVQEAENKGSFLMKLIHMRAHLAQYNGLGDFISLLEKINQLEDQINVYVQHNREKNQQIKSALLAEADVLKASTDWKEATEQFKELKLKWIKTGSAHKEVETDLNERFNAANDHFYNRRKEFFAEQNRIQKERSDHYYRLLQTLRRINQDGSAPELVETVKELQQEWKTVGRINKRNFLKISGDFRRQTDLYFNRLKKHREEAPLVQKTPIETKKELLLAAEKVLQENAPFNIPVIKRMQSQWKRIGKLTLPEDRDLNLRFRIVCNEIFESHFLDMDAKKQHEDFGEKPVVEQIRLKISMLKASVKQDEEELNELFSQGDAGPGRGHVSTREYVDPQLYQKRNNYVNRLKTKERILKKLQEMHAILVKRDD